MKNVLAYILCLITASSLAQKLETIIQRGHELAVLSVTISPDSIFAATGSKDKSAKLWDLHTGREVRSFLGHEASVTAVAFSADGKLLATGSNDKHVKLWETETGRERVSLKTGDYISAVVLDPNNRFLAYGGYNTTGYGDSIFVVEITTKKLIAKIATNPDKGLGSGVSLSISSDGKFMAVGEDNRVAKVFETTSWKEIARFETPEGFCGGCGTLVAFDKQNKFLYVASRHGDLRRYSCPDFVLRSTYQNNIDDIKGLAISSDGKRVAFTAENNAQVFDVEKGTVIDVLKAEPEANFHKLDFAMDNQRLIIASDNNTAIVWNFASSKVEKPLSGFLTQRDRGGLHYDPNFYWQSHIAKYVRLKNKIMVTPDGKTLVKGKFGTKVKQWDIATGRTFMEYTAHKKAVLAFDLSRDAKTLLSGGGDGKIILWNMSSGDSLRVIASYREPIFDIHFSSDESKIISSSWDGTMKIHDANTGALLHNISMENASAYNVQFHPSDLYVFTARLDNSLQMWEIDTKSVVRSFVGHTNIISSLSVSKDERTLLTSSWDGTIRLWDIGTGLMKKKFIHSATPLHVAVFNADEKFIYSAGADRVIKVWDVSTSQVVRQFVGHNAEISSLIFSPDNKLLISHSLDGVTKFWDLTSGKEFFEHIHIGDNDWLVKNTEGYFTATEGARRYIHFVNGKKTFSIDQFFEDFYRPDLMPKIFQNRGANDVQGIQGKLKKSPPPLLKVALLPGDNNRAELLIRMINSGTGVKDLQVMHNGKSIAVNHNEIQYPAKKDEHSTNKLAVDLVAGTNTFTVLARNNENVESDPRSVEIFSESGNRESTCYILAVGINEYKNTRLNLNYAKPDAVSFSEVMNDKDSPLFRNIRLYTLFDGEATKQRILQTMDELSDVIKAEDVFMLYYAGHGSMVDNKFYFIPTENLRLYDQQGLRKEAIEASVLQEKLKNIRALKQLIIMDACQSGGSVELLATRGANEEKAIAQLSRSSGIHVLASAGSEQFATEFSELGHGLFTFVLLKALQGEADGAPKDGKVTIYELKSYIDDQVPEMTRKLKGKPQYPYTFSRGHDFPVVIRR